MDASKNIKRKLINVSKKTGKGSISIYYSIGGKEKYFPTGIKLPASKWHKDNSTYRRGSLSDENAAIVDNLYTTLYSLITDYQYKYNLLPPIQYLIDGLSKPEEEVPEQSVIKLMGEWIDNNCLVFYPNKTKGKNLKAVVPISKIVKEILERYNYKLPVIKRSNLTIYIKKLCGNIESLKKNIMYKGKLVPKYSILSTHNVGRKTFINLCVQQQLPISTIMGYTAHSSYDTIIKSYMDKHVNNTVQLSKVFEF